jgi:hypothetical protein
MSEPIAERLSQFTPDSRGLDRDALLFAAGRASARPNRRWMAVAAGLAACQLLTLGLLWLRPGPSPTPSAILVESGPFPTVIRPGGSSSATDDVQSWAMRWRLLAANSDDLPPPISVDDPEPSPLQLRAFALPSSLMD